jgi:hypothetical protein
MNRDEQKQITQLIESATQEPPGASLPPLDIEADAIIRAMFVRNPEAAYRITMLALGQARELEAQRSQISESNAAGRRGWLSRLLKKRQPASRQTFSGTKIPRAANL